MKQTQGSFFVGYVTIKVKGNMPELFFQDCIHVGVPVWNVKRTGKNTCIGNVNRSDIPLIRKIRKRKDYKISFVHKKGIPFILERFMKKKHFLIASILSLFFIVFLSNIIWKVEVTGVPTDLEKKITNQLTSYGIHPGTWTFTLDSPVAIQQKLLHDIPELLWIGVEKKGTTFQLEGVEKLIVTKEKVHGPRHLVAAKKGVIKKMYVSKGLPQVYLNDYVEPGEIIVSGDLTSDEEPGDEKENEDEEDTRVLVSAEGEIIARTWYEVSVTIPLEANYELYTGEQENKYFLRIFSWQVPIWNFKSPKYEATYVETIENPIHFFKWQLPITVVEAIHSEKSSYHVERTKKEAIKIGMEQARKELNLELGPEATIISEKVLHERTENGKVKLNLYITVEEDIAEPKPIR
ncbi:sporulation protein YqfD [Virgibacillus soli]|uniref:sporulation protein YqfD n=1 Tax=Paracerasibacillus soli TaxID=480284 RepID=UPI0035EDD7BC